MHVSVLLCCASSLKRSSSLYCVVPSFSNGAIEDLPYRSFHIFAQQKSKEDKVPCLHTV